MEIGGRYCVCRGLGGAANQVAGQETEAPTKVGEAIREAIGQHLVSISTPTTIDRENKNAANDCGIRLPDGGRERSRTSDPYSVKVRKERDQASFRTIEDE